MTTPRVTDFSGLFSGQDRGQQFTEAYLGGLAAQIGVYTQAVDNTKKSLLALGKVTDANRDSWARLNSNLATQTKELLKLQGQYAGATKLMVGFEKGARLATNALKITTVVMGAVSLASSKLALEMTQVSNATGIATDQVLRMQSGFSALTGIDDAAQSLRRFADAQDLVNFRLTLGQVPTLEYILAIDKLGASLGNTGQFTLKTYEAFRLLDRGTRLSIASQLGLGEAILRAADEGRTAQEVAATGIVQSEDQIRLNRELNQSWGEMRNNITQTALAISAEFKPEIQEVLGLVENLVTGMASFVANNRELIRVAVDVAIVLASLRTALALNAVVLSFISALVPGGIGRVAGAAITAAIVGAGLGVAGFSIAGIRSGGTSQTGTADEQERDAEFAADKRNKEVVQAVNRVETATRAAQAARAQDLVLPALTGASNEEAPTLASRVSEWAQFFTTEREQREEVAAREVFESNLQTTGLQLSTGGLVPFPSGAFQSHPGPSGRGDTTNNVDITINAPSGDALAIADETERAVIDTLTGLGNLN